MTVGFEFVVLPFGPVTVTVPGVTDVLMVKFCELQLPCVLSLLTART